MKLIKSNRSFDKNETRRRHVLQIPVYIFVMVFITFTAGAATSVFWIIKKDNQIEKERRLKIYLQNQIKERDILLQQTRQEIEQLKRRVEILDAIKEFSKANIPESDMRKIAHEVDQAGQKYGHDPLFLLALMSTESSFRPQVQSHKGAHGLMQIMPSTGRALTEQIKQVPQIIGKETIEESDLPHYRDIEGNITLGALYITKLMLRYNSVEKAIYAYNLGPTLLDKRLKEGGPVPRKYLAKIMAKYQKFQEHRDQKFYAPPVLALNSSQQMLAQADPVNY